MLTCVCRIITPILVITGKMSFAGNAQPVSPTLQDEAVANWVEQVMELEWHSSPVSATLSTSTTLVPDNPDISPPGPVKKTQLPSENNVATPDTFEWPKKHPLSSPVADPVVPGAIFKAEHLEEDDADSHDTETDSVYSEPARFTPPPKRPCNRGNLPEPTVGKSNPIGGIFTADSVTFKKTLAISIAKDATKLGYDINHPGRPRIVYFTGAARTAPLAGTNPHVARTSGYGLVERLWPDSGWSPYAYALDQVIGAYGELQVEKQAIAEALCRASLAVKKNETNLRRAVVTVFTSSKVAVEHIEAGVAPETIYTNENSFDRDTSRPIDLVIEAEAGKLRAMGCFIEVRWLPKGPVGQKILADDLARTPWKIVGGENHNGWGLEDMCAATANLEAEVDIRAKQRELEKYHRKAGSKFRPRMCCHSGVCAGRF
ncbi:hypothetical protein B0H66DRAFT_613636 [Apodospora peruviana]|uniref:Uncharacterized protein n=1 Tax=Apodospora peruviana TaxID=516989 RepID=A0AAE0MHM2_9PEZI|nr:hypothetical protein B0H66DRAFT_613636 [Apodospora peruviana]